ncbi:MAG TPA: YbhB/YbcL family Raf kinase inhibitor-like protein [Chromatiaceae bacterium]|nr:YbhB/YbcL family Raf kinase inhibitor-like protein [Chromatiaceae bacterium]
MSLILTSTAFTHGGIIPRRHTCAGEDISPDLAWSGVPADTQSLVLLIDDPDAPDPQAPRTVWDHWVLYNLPPDAVGLPAGIQPADLPPGTRQGLNSWGRTGYGGPCPPIGRHRYFHLLYALDCQLPDLGEPHKNRLLAAMDEHILARAELVGTYQKGDGE